ncbi:MAG: LamG-like jellyroll fold domain-containing protein, partial [Planctomycetota bacterium]
DSGADNNTLTANTANSKDYGIALFSSSGNILTDNTANSNDYVGIELLYGSNNNLLKNNTAKFNRSYGVWCYSASNNNTVINNTLTSNPYGLVFTQSLNNNVYQNNIYGNTAYNVYADQAVELSYFNPSSSRREGNWWGRTSVPGFIAGVDSNSTNVTDSYPYLVKDGWSKGYAPGEPEIIDTTPPIIYYPTPGSGAKGSAFSFDGINDYFDLGTNSSFRQSSAITYAFWVKVPAEGGGYIMGTGASGGHGYGGLYINLAAVVFSWTPTIPQTDTHVIYIYNNNLSLKPDEWTHIAVTVDFANQQRSMYINGQSVPTTLSQNATNWTPSGIYNANLTDSIGARYVNNWLYFKGLIDEVSVYNRFLNQAEVNALAATSVIPTDGLLSWWTGDNTSNDLWATNHGTLTNGAGYTDIPVLTNSRPTISVSYLDKITGINQNTAKIFLDTIDVTARAGVTAQGISYLPAADLTNGEHTVQVEVKDFAGNQTQQTWSFKIQTDATPPTGSIMIEAGAEAISKTEVTLLLFAADPESGITQMRFSNDAANWTAWMPYLSPKTYNLSPPDGTKTVYVEYKNGVGLTAVFSDTIILDSTPPVISATQIPLPNAAGWNNTDVTVSFSATDALSGIAGITPPVILTTEGAGQVVTGTATDKAGNSAGINITVNIDKTAPLAFITGYSPLVKGDWGLSTEATDNLSNIERVEYFIDTDPGQGNGFLMDLSGGSGVTTTTATASIAITALS